MEPSARGRLTGPDPRLDQAPPGLAERARRLGPLPYSTLGPSPAPAGLPAVDELAAWESETVDGLWEQEGRPDPFTVVQVPAGDGAVAARMLSARPEPACSAALRLVLVEPDEVLRHRHAGLLPVESPALLLGPVTTPADPDEDPVPAAGIGPIVASLTEVPAVRGSCVVIAVGWMSRFEYDLFEWREGRWHEVRLSAASDSGDELEAITVVLDPDRASRLDDLVEPGGRFEGARYALRPAAASWLRGAVGAGESGWVVGLDLWIDRTSPVAHGDPVPVALDQLPPVLPQAGGLVLPQAGRPVLPQAGGPVLPQAGGPVLPQAGGPVLPQAGGPVLPQAGGPVLPQAGGPVLPQAGGPAGLEAMHWRIG